MPVYKASYARMNGFFTTSTEGISNLTKVQLNLCCQHQTKQAEGGIAPLVLKVHTKRRFGEFRNPVALSPQKELPVRTAQHAVWAPQPVLRLADKQFVAHTGIRTADPRPPNPQSSQYPVCPTITKNFPFNPLNTKRRLFYFKAQFVPRSKHFSSRL